jgi:hypothetical protein
MKRQRYLLPQQYRRTTWFMRRQGTTVHLHLSLLFEGGFALDQKFGGLVGVGGGCLELLLLLDLVQA